ncbi:MAG: FAD-binding protein [Lachnospiraceae bacterium]|nr:FAD-binding protein [Lachnospiraceae bacterium]
MFRLDNIHLEPPIENEKDELIKYLVHKLRLPGFQSIEHLSVLKRSLDARKKPELFYVYSVSFDFKDRQLGIKLLQMGEKRNGGLRLWQEKETVFPKYLFHVTRENERPVVVGSGPAGLFCAYQLAKAGLKPIVVERGGRVEERSKIVDRFWTKGELDPECNVQFGEGGAGTFSDGKLYTQTDDKDGVHREVLRLFVEFGAPSDILCESHPHIGTDILKQLVQNFRLRLESMGTEFFFHTRFERPILRYGKLEAVELSQRGRVFRHYCNSCVLAIGHSARDTYRALHDSGVIMSPKPFAVGFRVQHDQDAINKNQYGAGYKDKKLPAAEYRLAAKVTSGRGVYSFCMCPGGYVIHAASTPGSVCVNGMSYHGRASLAANSAIVITVDQDIFGRGLFDGLNFQEQLEKAAARAAAGAIPLQCLGDFAAGRGEAKGRGIEPQIKGIWHYAPLNGILPAALETDMVEAFSSFGRMIRGFDDPQTLLAGVESRTSAPLRIERNEGGQSNISGIFPCGEGAGYAGGITSAAVDGVRTAWKLCAFLKNKA